MRLRYFFPLFILVVACNSASQEETLPLPTATIETATIIVPVTETSLVILGTLQDAGAPQIACKKICCKNLFDHPDKNRKVVSLGIVDPENQKKYIFEATPDLPEQMRMLKGYAGFNEQETPDGIFLTHAHIGHYSGLMYLGKEAMNADSVPVYAMPKMKTFLKTNGPWSQLVMRKNIAIQELAHQTKIELTNNLTVIPFTVPHRDEYSETVGYKIIGPNKIVLFIPDIDKWNKWETNIIEAIAEVDYAFIDATFFDGEEINTRNISEIPHPFIIESMKLFKDLPAVEKSKIHFIHFNHTNPVLKKDSKQVKTIIDSGFNVSHIYDLIKL